MGDQGTDPNEKDEPKGKITTPKGADFGEKENPVVETPTPFTGLRDGGTGAA
jgi:hypothetical protein